MTYAMSTLSEELRKIAELNFCKDCYPKYLALIHGEIEYLLSEPIADWRETEQNINYIWIKAIGLYTVKSGVFSICQIALEEAYSHKNPISRKLDLLKSEGLIEKHTYDFLKRVCKKRNKIHPPQKFSKEDYFLFQEAKKITNLLYLSIVHDSCSDIWKNGAYIEMRAKKLLEKTVLWSS